MDFILKDKYLYSIKMNSINNFDWTIIMVAFKIKIKENF